MSILKKFAKLSTSNVADALDKLKISGWVQGVVPITVDPVKVTGRATTVRLARFSPYTPNSNLQWGDIVDKAEADDVVVISVGSFLSSWGELLSAAAKLKDIVGTVTDGAVRDVSGIRKVGYPVFARGRIPLTAKYRVQVQEIGGEINCGGVKVLKGDIVVGDDSGAVVVPSDRESDVYELARGIAETEEEVRRDILKGISIKKAHELHGYYDLTTPVR